MFDRISLSFSLFVENTNLQIIFFYTHIYANIQEREGENKERKVNESVKKLK